MSPWYSIGPRTKIVAALLLIGCVCVWRLELSPADLALNAASLSKAGEFFSAAIRPALTYQTPPPAGAAPLLTKVVSAAATTIVFAVVAVGLALPVGAALAFLASAAWWEDDAVAHQRRPLRRWVAPLIVGASRTVIAITRSIHELLWAVLFLSALGLNNLTAVLAIAIPYSGVFAKVFSEIIDETPRDAALALRSSGASPLVVFWVGLIPRATPDMTAYACYRLECGMRSSAVMGFFGVTTLGYYLQPAFDEQHYREVWTYLYALLTLVIVADVWSGMMRRRLVR